MGSEVTPRLIPVASGYAIPSHCVARGTVQPPPSKSITQRVLNLTLLARSPIEIKRPLLAEDTDLFLASLESLGFECERQEGGIALAPGVPADRAQLWCGNNGTMLRFLTAALTTVPGDWLLDGSERLRQRPIGPLVEALRSLGANIRYEDRQGFAPVAIVGGSLQGGSVELDASLSSQFVSAMLMAATQAEDEVVFKVRALVSAPYLQLTRKVLAAFGATVLKEPQEDVFRVQPTILQQRCFEVEGDFSSAAYPAAAAILTGGVVSVQGMDQDSEQGDKGFLEVLSAMGADIEWDDRGFKVRAGGPLTGIDVDFSRMPDQVPTLAALAPFAAGRTRIRNVRHLRIKESDRLAAMAGELRRMGASIQERPDGLEIEGTWADRERIPREEIEVETHGDHRVAMSLAVCGLARPGVTVGTPDVVAKSYPSFWDDLNHLLRG